MEKEIAPGAKLNHSHRKTFAGDEIIISME